MTDGYLRLEGRLKEIIVRGGENISPQEIENVLLSHEAVADAVCFGTENEKYGEEVEAAVVPNGTVQARELQEHCRKQLATFKVPKVIHTVEALPRTATGKLQRWRVSEVVENSGS